MYNKLPDKSLGVFRYMEKNMSNEPLIGKAYIASNATIVGDVTLADDCNVWYGAVIRGDCGHIEIGEGTDIQDNCILHDGLSIGKFCVVGHGAIVHGCTVGDNCLIGMGSIIMSDAVIGEGSIIGAGAVVLGGTVIPPRSVAVGNPAKVVKTVSDEQLETTKNNALWYIKEAHKNFG